MSVLPKSVEKVIEEFGKLPGIGPKSAARMAYHYLRSPNKDASKLAKVLQEMEEKTVFCKQCFNISENEICDICSSELRDKSMICVVEEPMDVVAIESSGTYNGLYFVLGGVISPADGISAEELRFDSLKDYIVRIIDRDNKIELLIATNPSLEGEATSNYIVDMFKKELDDQSIIISRLAMGLPTGADLEYADNLTLKRALEGRRKVE